MSRTPEPPDRSAKEVITGVARVLRLTWEAGRGRFVETVLLQVVIGLAAGAQLIIIRNLIAAVMEGSTDHTLTVQIVLFVITDAIAGFVGLYQNQQQQILSERLSRSITERMMVALSQVELREFDEPHFQDRLRRAHGVLGRVFTITLATVNLIRSSFLILGVGAALYVLSPVMLIVMLVAFVPMWIATMATSRIVQRFVFEMSADDRRRDYVVGLFASREAKKDIRVLGLADYLRGVYRTLADARLSRLEGYLQQRTRLALGGSLVSAVLHGFGFGLLAYLVGSGAIGLPEAGAAAAASVQLGSYLGLAIGSVGQLNETGSLFLEAQQFFTPTVSRASSDGRRHLPEKFSTLVADNVSFSYGGPHARSALRGVSLEIRSGEIVALVGENGSGKTTLAKILSGLYRPDVGRVCWDDHDLASFPSAAVHERIAILFQDFARFLFSVRENIGFGRVADLDDEQRIHDAARKAGAENFITGLEKGFDTVLSPWFDGGRDTSGGEWQRIALARAFFRDVPLVILDEPTASLDPRGEHELFSRMRELFRGRSVLLISHRFSSARLADRIYVLHEGRVVERGTHEELVRLSGRYAELFGLQATTYSPGPYVDGKLPPSR